MWGVRGSGQRWWQRAVLRRLPVLGWLPRYSLACLRLDVTAGVTVGLTVVPQALAYAEVAGLPVQNILGLRGIPRQFFLQVYETLRRIGETRVGDAVLGLACLAALAGLRAMKSRLHPTARTEPLPTRASILLVRSCATARNALVVLAAGLVAYSFQALPNGTVPFSRMVQDMGAGLAVVPLVGVLETVAIAKAFASQNDYRIDANQELLAMGAANVLGSFFSSYPITGSFGRTAVNAQTGVCTPMGGLVTGTLVLLSLAYLTSLFCYIPKAALAAVIISAVVPMFDARIFRTLWRVKRLDLVPLCVTFLLCFWEVQYGIMAGVLVSGILLLYPVARPPIKVLEQGMLLVQPGSSLHFPATDHLRDIILDRALAAVSPPCSVVLDCHHVSSIDYTAVVGLAELMQDLHKHGISLVFCSLQDPVLQVLLAADLEGFLHFPSWEEAEPGGELKDEGAGGPSSTTETVEEKKGGSLQEDITAPSSASVTTPECTADELSSATEKEEVEEEGELLQVDVAALSDISETDPQRVADGSSQKSKRKEAQTSGGEASEQSADLIASDNGGAQENGAAMGPSVWEAEGLEMVTGGGCSTVDVVAPSREGSTGNGAAPSPGSAALKEKAGGGSTAHRGVGSSVEGKSAVSGAGQPLETRLDSQSLDGQKKPVSMGERTDVSSASSPDTEVPKSKPATSHTAHQNRDITTPSVANSSKAGKGKHDSNQKASSLPSKEKGTMEKKTPNEKAHETSEKTKKSETKGPQVASENGASAVMDKCKEKHHQSNQKPVDKDEQRSLEAHGYLIGGYAILPKECVDKLIPYKYWVSCGEGEYEVIYKTESKDIVNRCLCVNSILINNGEWHQYDDIVCKKPSLTRSLWNRFLKSKDKDIVEGKKIAAEVMLENIFSILETWSIDNMRNFLYQLEQFHAVTRNPCVYDGGYLAWSELGFGPQQVNDLLLEFLRRIARPFLLPEDAEASREGLAIKSKLALGLTLLTVVNMFQLPASKEDLTGLCRLLCLEKKSREAIAEEVLQTIRVFVNHMSLKLQLITLCQRCIDCKVGHWVWILPLLHLCPDPMQHDHFPVEEDTWAGLEGLPFVETRKNHDVGTLLQLMKEKKYLMEFNTTVVKSWMSVLPVEDLTEFIEDFSVNILVSLQGVLYRLDNADPSFRKFEVIEKLVKMLLCALDRALQAHSWWSCLLLCLKLHERVCRRMRRVLEFRIPATTAMMISKVASLQPTEQVLSDETKLKNQVVEVFDKALACTRTWFRNALSQKLVKVHLNYAIFTFNAEPEAWNEFVKISFPDEQSTERWKSTLLADLERRIQEECPVNQIQVYCCQHQRIQGLNCSIGCCFENCAMKAVTAASQTKNSLLDLIPSYNMDQFSRLVSAIIVNSWPRKIGHSQDDFDDILQHLLTWPDIKHIFSFNGTKKLQEQLTSEARIIISIADSVFMNVTNDLQEGSILIKHLEEIFQHENRFVFIWELKHKELSHGQKEPLQRELEEVLQRRQEEVAHIRRERKAIGTFLNLCRKVQATVSVNVGQVNSQYLEDLCSKKLNGVVNVGKSPIQTYYSLSQELKECAQKMHTFKDSLVFLQFWEEAAMKAREKYDDSEEEEVVPEMDLDDVFDELFSPCFMEYEKLYDDLTSGNLTLSAVDRIFQKFANHPEDIKAELSIICELRPGEERGWVDRRFQQIQQYHEMHLTFDAVRIIANVRETLNLSGDFSVLETLLCMTEKLESYKTQKLDFISSELIRAKKLLQGITVSRCECLLELAQQKEFVCWVREALKDINELKVFVDLASISAGENDMDVDRVACFHDAVHGYSSLLYELSQESGFDDFMDCLRKLWRALDTDENLPKKLRASAQQLVWLKTVKESHGSVELSSLSLAATINSRGVYILKAPSDGQKVSLDNVLHLTLLESSEDHKPSWKYSLSELRELQNKLMLMSAKGDQGLEVEKFSETFSNVQRLAQAFIDLYSAGNMLFRSWLAHVHCSPKSELCVLIDFSLRLVPVLEGQGELADVLPSLCKTMESFLERWQSFMSKKRFQHFYLNYYTAEQLVYLCTELGQGQPNQNALMMLSFLKCNCTVEDVLRASESHEPPSSRQAVSDLSVLLDEERDLTTCLECIWECYTSNMGAFLPNCLDIDTLGVWLKSLASWEKVSVTREFPQDLLHVGQPNLITCPRSEVLTSALAVYMNSPNQPLPAFDEVLLCTPQTTAEQVGLFLRRCLIPSDEGEKIYTMLFADELSYDVSCRVEELFQHLQRYNSSYRLIILCNCEREHCYIPSVFSQYKVHMIPQRPLTEIQQYLQHHYRVAQPSNSAACVFKGNVCVGIVSSKRAGVGKSLYVKRLHERLEAQQPDHTELLKTIRLIEPTVDEDKVLQSLLPFLEGQQPTKPMIFHFDITSSVSASQKYNFLDIFPKVTCKSPKEVLEMETLRKQPRDASDPGMDEEEFHSEAFQRPFQYLRRFDGECNLDTFWYKAHSVEGSPAECLQLFLLHCGVMDPSWAELRNFTSFLNVQLRDCEASVFCNPEFVQDTLQGFKNFVVTFMILMARDFATPSLHISDESSGRQSFNLENIDEEDLWPFRIRKKWESEPHPYLFFNGDRVSMTFIGFHFKPNGMGGVDAINPLNSRIIKRNIMTSQLYNGLLLQRVPFDISFDSLSRLEKLDRLCMVLGISYVTDPDETYELTTDNVLKILAIEMRFRCNIPVVIMGETGCGKTRLVNFLCKLRRSFLEVENMQLVKVHGGTTAEMIYARVKEAEALAIANKKQHGLDTVLFFDEANTTEAVSSIKEVLCDRTVEGKPLVSCSGLQIIAACNPYRKHTPKMIQRLELAGLGYRVKADETKEKLGSIPLRQLVYRVHALPPSMIPLVWDFGQLNNLTEKMYIQQIVQRVTEHTQVNRSEEKVIAEVLIASQQYMRERDDECSFVSLRDVERCMEVFKWFHKHSELLLGELEKYLAEKRAPKGPERNNVIWSLVQAVGVCYHASLEKKEAYRNAISKVLPKPYYDTQKKILEEISLMQDLFLSRVHLRDTIARNLALKENVFMMVICIELKIPLFLVGKPGSSKSLAKTIVADAMQGQAAHSDLFKDLKQIHLVSFQCSPLSTPEGIIGTFKHCSRFQDGKNLEEYVSVVVLDEIGLAEDSPKMPLKTLHPLLEDGCIDDDPLPHKKVGFIGISNWALDPAKMNRGIFVSRGDPSKEELIESAKGICCSARGALHKVEQYFQHFANAYEKICKVQDREFFGLRDYYSLIKMFFALVKSSKSDPTPRDIAEVVLRNFSGKDDINALEIFTSQLPEKGKINAHDISRIELIQQNINSSSEDGDCRYLLVLTENYAALQILQQTFFTAQQQPEIIFGSSFPKDQEYTQICRNINRVKVCMETGQMVVLLNLQNLYESLYDALNQYYVYLAGQKYVDLGLGTHRVKCRVHPKFRLIVIEEKDVVYKHFPIPLINRLEKHYLDISTVLDKDQRETVKELKKWVRDFVAVNTTEHFMSKQKYSPSDVFVGYHSDTCASVVLQTTERLKAACPPSQLMERVKAEAQLALLNCATPDSVIRLCVSKGLFRVSSLADTYFKQQQHSSFADFLRAHICSGSGCQMVFTEVTTFSRLLTSADSACLEREVQGKAQRPQILFLQQFDTEYSFLKGIRDFLETTSGNKILIIQSDFEDGSQDAQLIASAKYAVFNEINKAKLEEVSVFVYFIMKLTRVEGGTSYVGFHGGLWQSVHIDDLRRSKDMISDMSVLQKLTISQMLCEGLGKTKAPPVDEEEESEGMAEAPVPEAEHCEGEVLDIVVLLRSCVQSAVGMLRDKNENLSRSRKRIEILLSLLSKENGLKASFLKTTRARLSSLLKKQEENSFQPKNWVLREASNLGALQEAGTFSSQTEVILVQNSMVVSADAGNKMPFSWRIKEYLDEMRLKAQYIQNSEDQAENFLDIFQKTALGEFISGLTKEERQEIFQCYVTDFIVLTIGVSSTKELQCFQEDSDMKTHQTFVAVMKVLCRCKEEVSNRLCRYDVKQCSVCHGEPKDPVQLQCNHVFCEKCIRTWLVPTHMHCPLCRVEVEDDNLIVSEELSAAIARNALFRQRCNNFFVDVVTTMCFKDNEPPDAAVIKELLNLLFVYRDCLEGSDRPTAYTKLLSPFDEEVDETPVIRSVMLKLLLKYSFSEVKDDVQDYLCRVEHSRVLDRTDKKELYLLFVNCLEDSMWEKAEGSLGYEYINSLLGDGGFPENYLPTSNQEAPQESSVEYLQAVAKVRLYLTKAPELLYDLLELTEQNQVEEKERYLENVKVFCNLTKNDWHRVYLTRKIAHLYGMEFAQKLVTKARFSWVFPVEILQQVQSCQSNHIDRYLAYGKNYKVLRDAVGKAMIKCNPKDLLEAEKASSSSPAVQSVHLLLAIFREVTALYGFSDSSLHPKEQQAGAMTKFIQNSKVLSSPDLQNFAESLVMNKLPSVLTVDPQSFSHNGALIEMAVHTMAILLCGQNPILQPLKNLAFMPHTMEHSFLPTMPEDVMVQARAWEGLKGLRMYTCPNGHPCTVGECGKPMEVSRCIECGLAVGGHNHNSLPGFHEFRSNEDRTQTGHVLGDAQHRKGLGVSDRSMSPAVFVLIRLLTHLTMLLGATRDPQSLRNIIKPPVRNSVLFLQQHIQEDLAQLTKIFGRSVDETINVLHLVLGSLLKDPHQHPMQWPVQFDGVLSTKEKRNKWEEVVANTVIIPELAETELRLVKCLPEILALQRDLVRLFQNASDAKRCTIREFLSKPLSDVTWVLLERRVDVFLSVWNKLRSSLDTNGEIKLPKGYCDADLTLDSKLEVLLPRRQGLGLCSTALVSYLISLQNDFIHSVNKHIKEDDRYLISPSEVADLHLISYEVERDLIPLILSNCQYSMEKGGETLQHFDLERIQQQVISKFLLGKPLITLTGIPTLVYRHDRNYEELFNDVRNKLGLHQSALPSSVMNMISGELQSYSDVCDALSVTEIALEFLAMAGENTEMLLTDYIKNVLQMGDQTNPHVLQALRRCHLKHTIALWQLLSTHKSEQLLRLRRDPFEDISTEYKADLSPEFAKLLNAYLVHSRLETFLQELHKMIILKLKRIRSMDEFRPTWGLKESLIPLLDEKDSELAAELQDTFPDEICLSHVTATWKAAAVFKRERRES
ncbi:UNVERIFIED_CONTAM: hypothetical protein H355_004990 [Colinus virginianus]|nr:hypothetical protein H355_004990 [Colinus virginianus]